MADYLAGSGGSAETTAAISEHDRPSLAKRVLVKGFDGVSYNTLNVDSSGALAVNATFGGTVTTSGSFAEDSIHTNGDVGIFSLAVRNDGGTALSGDQRYTPFTTDNRGSLWVAAQTLPLPAGAATSALQTQPGVDIGDVTVNNAAGASAINIQDGGNSITVDGTVTVNPAASTLTATTISTDTEVSVTTSTTALLAANASRKRVWIQNHGTGFVRVRLAATALTTSPIRLVPTVGTYEILPSDGYLYRGVINAISESGTNLVGVIEET